MVVWLIVICWIGGRGGACTKAGGRTHGLGPLIKGTTGTGKKKAPIGAGGGASTTNSGGGGGQKNPGNGGGGREAGPSNNPTGRAHGTTSHPDRLAQVDHFIRWRRLHIRKRHWRERRRRIVGGREPRQTALRIRHVGALRIALQIRPVGLWRVDRKGAPPRNGFTPHRDERTHAPCQRTVRKPANELLIAAERIAFHRRHISVLVAAQTPDRLTLQFHAGGNLGRRRRVCGPLREEKRLCDL